MMDPSLNEALTDTAALEVDGGSDVPSGRPWIPSRGVFRCLQVAAGVLMISLVLVVYHFVGEDVAHPDRNWELAAQETEPPLVGETSPRQHQTSAQAALICGGDAASVGHTGRRELVSREWLQETTERRRVKLWGAGGRGGAPVRLVPEGGCAPAERRLRHRGGYRGTGTRADLNNHANQMNPNNWRYWSSRGMSPPWRSQASSGFANYAPYREPSVGYHAAPPAARVAQSQAPAAQSGSSNSNAFRFRRGLPLSVARLWARRALRAARKWLPRERRWRVSDSDPLSVGPCGELWLCGAGGGSGAFTDAVVNLTAGRRYALEVGTGGLPGNLRGGTTCLVEINEAGVRQTLAEAAGGFGAVDVDEERMVTLGGAGAPASEATGLLWSQPGIDGEASRSSFEDLQSARLPLAGANLQAVKDMALDELNLSLAAVRIPCAAAVKDGAAEFEAGLTGTSARIDINSDPLNLNTEQYSISRRVIRDRKKEPVTDHMLVCLPEDAGANGYNESFDFIGDLYILDPTCVQDDFNPDLKRRGYQTDQLQHQINGENCYIGRIVDFQGKRNVFQLADGYFQPIGPRVSYEKGSRCFVSEQGSQCLGSACVRETPGQGPCGALASCLDGLAAWANVLPLGNPTSVQNDGSYSRRYDSLLLRKSSSGPRGGASTATPNGRPAGHGGEGSCPELLVDSSRLAPMDRALPRHVAPQNGENGMAIFYDCED